MTVFVSLLVLASSGDSERVIASATVKGNMAARVVFKEAGGRDFCHGLGSDPVRDEYLQENATEMTLRD
jgi:hypothetical protein